MGHVINAYSLRHVLTMHSNISTNQANILAVTVAEVAATVCITVNVDINTGAATTMVDQNDTLWASIVIIV